VVYSQTVLAESYIVPQCIARPGTLGGLMTLYESNFIKLHGLLPLLLSIPVEGGPSPASRVSASPRDLDLHVYVDAVTRYTVDLRLTYLFAEPAGVVPDPDLQLRAYLDARVVEVLGWSVGHHHEVLKSLALASSRELDRRWARNIMLGKWLDYLCDMGHTFPAT
jgi:uncharacterized protein YqiB (DUF1249 family)